MSSTRSNHSPEDRSGQQISLIIPGQGDTRIVVRYRARGRAGRDQTEAESHSGRGRWRRFAGISVEVATVVTAVATVWLLLR
jgi:hypothetical protein